MESIRKDWKNQNLMKVSVCVTIFNEKEETVQKLVDALNSQTLKPDEIIIVDAKDYDNCSRSEGRNIAIRKARNEIIAITDAGCIPHKDWLQKITLRLRSRQAKPDVVAGGYKMIVKNNFQKAESIFLGTQQKDMKKDFMSSARSMVFTKSIWKKAGGFPEKLEGTAEDTLFNLQLLNVGAKFKIAKNAIVDWQMPGSIYDFGSKIYAYAKGDAQSGVWWHPVKKFKTHNLKVISIILRYLIFISVLLKFGYLYLLVLIGIYSLWVFKKAKAWGILLQFTSDFACIIGFSHGILQKSFKRT